MMLSRLCRTCRVNLCQTLLSAGFGARDQLQGRLPQTSAKCAGISQVVKPFAVKNKTISWMPASRRWRFLTICGSKAAVGSRGTSISTGPISVNTVGADCGNRKAVVHPGFWPNKEWICLGCQRRTSTYATVGWRHGHVATEDNQIDRRRLSPYVKSRVQAEDLVLRYASERALPAVAMCVSTTYGSGDWGRTPHGAFIAGAVFGKLPFLMNGIQLEVVGDAAGVPPPRGSISVPTLYGALGSVRARLTGRDAELRLASVRMMRAEADVDHSKACRELGWQRRPVEESIREAVLDRPQNAQQNIKAAPSE